MSTTNNAERSVSRGRENLYFSSGRGGAGNIRPSSTSRDVDTRKPYSNETSPVRGRELANASASIDQITHGRGGAGNIRSPSREGARVAQESIQLEQKLLEEKRSRDRSQEVPISSGRGGAGNISRSRSRSREPSGLQSSGRGGFGNLTGDGRPSQDLGKLEEEERKAYEKGAEAYGSGRGGFGNVYSGNPPSAHYGTNEQTIRPSQDTFVATGRGGAGNYYPA